MTKKVCWVVSLSQDVWFKMKMKHPELKDERIPNVGLAASRVAEFLFLEGSMQRVQSPLSGPEKRNPCFFKTQIRESSLATRFFPKKTPIFKNKQNGAPVVHQKRTTFRSFGVFWRGILAFTPKKKHPI